MSKLCDRVLCDAPIIEPYTSRLAEHLDLRALDLPMRVPVTTDGVAQGVGARGLLGFNTRQDHEGTAGAIAMERNPGQYY